MRVDIIDVDAVAVLADRWMLFDFVDVRLAATPPISQSLPTKILARIELQLAAARAHRDVAGVRWRLQVPLGP